MTVLNDLDRFHLVMDTIDRLPQSVDKGIDLKQQLEDKLIEHKQYIAAFYPWKSTGKTTSASLVGDTDLLGGPGDPPEGVSTSRRV
jgi:hypothetical protein